MTLAGEPKLLIQLPNRAAVPPAFELPAHVVDLLQAQCRPGPGRDAQCFTGGPGCLLNLALPDVGGGESGQQASTDLGRGRKHPQAGLEGGPGVVEPAKPHVAEALLTGEARAVKERDDGPRAIGILSRLDGIFAAFQRTKEVRSFR